MPTSAQIDQANDDAALARLVGLAVPIVRAIRSVESGGNPAAVRFETRLFRERTGETIEGTTRSTFERAFRVNPRAAVESSSWGKYQVLGGYLLPLFSSPAAAVAAFDADPSGVGDSMFAGWMNDHQNAREKAVQRDFYGFAHIYNGCSDCAHYAGRFESAYARAVDEWEVLQHYVSSGWGWLIPVAIGAAAGAGVLFYRRRRRQIVF